jgi:hypothetical protein
VGEVLNVFTISPIQFSLLAIVDLGKAGLTIGFDADGFALLVLKVVLAEVEGELQGVESVLRNPRRVNCEHGNLRLNLLNGGMNLSWLNATDHPRVKVQLDALFD